MKKSKKKKSKKTNKTIENNNIKNNPIAIVFILIRYLILLALMFSLPLIYQILTPLTINSLFFLLKIFYENVNVLEDLIAINYKYFIRIIPACIAGSAYLLLLILNFTVAMNFKKRIFTLLFSIFCLFTINLLRLLFFSFLYVSGSDFFDFAHILFWYLLSLVFVIGIWFLTAKLFSIKEIPIYTDIKILIKNK